MGIAPAIKENKIIKAETIDASGTFDSSVIKLAQSDMEGFFSIQLGLTGSGVITVEYLLSNNGDDFVRSGTIVTGYTSTSGQDNDGKDIISFTPPVSSFMKIRATETGGASSAIVSGWLNYQ